jgi:hypothetical protein
LADLLSVNGTDCFREFISPGGEVDFFPASGEGIDSAKRRVTRD